MTEQHEGITYLKSRYGTPEPVLARALEVGEIIRRQPNMVLTPPPPELLRLVLRTVTQTQQDNRTDFERQNGLDATAPPEPVVEIRRLHFERTDLSIWSVLEADLANQSGLLERLTPLEGLAAVKRFGPLRPYQSYRGVIMPSAT